MSPPIRLKEVKKMFFKVPYIAIAPIASAIIQFVSNFAITTSPDGGASKIVLNIAIDPNKSGGQVEFPVFVPAEGNYPSSDINYMRKRFEQGDPFVTVIIRQMDVYYKEENGKGGYVGFADTFEVVANPMKYIEEEDAL